MGGLLRYLQILNAEILTRCSAHPKRGSLKPALEDITILAFLFINFIILCDVAMH